MTQRHTLGAGKLTYDDLLDITDESKRYEILDGDLAVTPSPATRHQLVSARLGNLLYNYVHEHRLGEILWAPMDVILDIHTVVEPDILFISKARSAIIQPHAIVGAPDLLVEILSPSTSGRDKGIKAKLYARFGVEHYWLVDPLERKLGTFRRDAARPAEFVSTGSHETDAAVHAEPFPQLTIELASIWE